MAAIAGTQALIPAPLDCGDALAAAVSSDGGSVFAGLAGAGSFFAEGMTLET
jgi:hypothetical protein